MSETGVGVRSGGAAPRVSFSLVLGLTASGLTAADSALPAAAPARADSNNSLGATPLMGWRNWSYIESDPTTAKIEAQATVMKSSGLLSYGYQYINLLPVQLQRPEVNANGPWKVDPSKFPQRRLDPGHGGPGQLLPRRGREGRRVCDPASPVTR
jgi:hypothetical protein